MKLYRLILINAILYIGLGIAFALYGPIMIQVYGMLDFPGAEGGLYWFTASFARVLGALLFGYGFLLWAVRDLLATGTITAEKTQRTTLALLLGGLCCLSPIPCASRALACPVTRAFFFVSAPS